MKIAHSSDWHAGRFWKNRDRLPEMGKVLEHLGDTLEKERVDLLLVTGDVFDSGAPNAEAERLVFQFFKRVGQAGIQTAVIAGNHDSPARLEAWGTLAELVHVRTVARPCPADRGGLLTFETRGNERALVAAVPFAATRHLVSAAEIAADDTLAYQRYADGMQRIVEHLAARFRAEAVNLLMAHTHLHGALLSDSERRVHIGEEWAATPQALPPQAHYVALGHIHRPQAIPSAPSPTHYAGSPLQLDFGEAGEEKSFVLIDARPGQPAHIERVPYQGGKPLLKVRATLEELERDAPRLAQAGWLRVTVPLAQPDPELNARVRRLLPDAVSVEVELPEAESPERPAAVRGLTPAELFRGYSVARHGTEPEPSLLEAFQDLYQKETEATAI